MFNLLSLKLLKTTAMNIVITGASQGIGYATAVELAKNGSHTIICISRNEAKLKYLQNEIDRLSSNTTMIPMPFDLLKLTNTSDEPAASISKLIGKVDILINNAGLLHVKSLTDLTPNEIQSMVVVNYLAPTLLIRQMLPYMNKSSHVVNISSMGGFQGSAKFPGLSVYASSKAALASLTENLAEEYKDLGISFNCLALGATDTEMFRQAFPGFNAPQSAKGMANFIAYFAINGNKFFNGKILPVSLSTP